MPKEKSFSYPSEDEQERVSEDRELEAQIASMELVPLAESPAMNRLLIRHGRKTFNEIAAATGLPVGEVQERMSKLLDNKAWRDDLMEEKLVLAEIGMLLEDIRERMQRTGVEDEAWASMARVNLAASKTILENLKDRRKTVDNQLALVTRMQAELMAEAIRLAMDRAVFTLEQKYPELEATVIREAFEEALPGAMVMVEAQVKD